MAGELQSEVLCYANGSRVVCPPCATPAEVEELDRRVVVVLRSDEWAGEVLYHGVSCERCGKTWKGLHGQEVFE